MPLKEIKEKVDDMCVVADADLQQYFALPVSEFNQDADNLNKYKSYIQLLAPFHPTAFEMFGPTNQTDFLKRFDDKTTTETQNMHSAALDAGNLIAQRFRNEVAIKRLLARLTDIQGEKESNQERGRILWRISKLERENKGLNNKIEPAVKKMIAGRQERMKSIMQDSKIPSTERFEILKKYSSSLQTEASTFAEVNGLTLPHIDRQQFTTLSGQVSEYFNQTKKNESWPKEYRERITACLKLLINEIKAQEKAAKHAEKEQVKAEKEAAKTARQQAREEERARKEAEKAAKQQAKVERRQSRVDETQPEQRQAQPMGGSSAESSSAKPAAAYARREVVDPAVLEPINGNEQWKTTQLVKDSDFRAFMSKFHGDLIKSYNDTLKRYELLEKGNDPTSVLVYTELKIMHGYFPYLLKVTEWAVDETLNTYQGADYFFKTLNGELDKTKKAIADSPNVRYINDIDRMLAEVKRAMESIASKALTRDPSPATSESTSRRSENEPSSPESSPRTPETVTPASARRMSTGGPGFFDSNAAREAAEKALALRGPQSGAPKQSGVKQSTTPPLVPPRGGSGSGGQK